MSVTIIPAYVIEVYSWTQDYAIYLQILGSLISTLSAAFSVSLIPKYGARKVILASFAVLSVAQLFFVLSILSPVFLVLANILNGSAFAATPAYYEEITRFIPQNEQGRIQSGKSISTGSSI
jgi:MFS family permease